MAIDQAPYRVVRHETVVKAVRWALNRLNLRDWEVDISYGATVPDWIDPDGSFAAQSKTNPAYLTAAIWVAPRGCKVNDFHPVSTALHEVLHIFFHSYDIMEHDERMINTMEELLFKQWEVKG